MTSIDRRLFLAGAAALAARPAAAAPDAADDGGVRIERMDPRLDRLVAPDARAAVIVTGQHWAEGPVWADNGCLIFSDTSVGATRRWSPTGGLTDWLGPWLPPGTDPKSVREGGTNGLVRGERWRLLAAHSGLRAVVALDPASGRPSILADRYQGKRLNSPNDLAVARDGAVWFTDPPYGLEGGDASPLKEQAANRVYRLAPDGRLTAVVEDLSRPNGLGLSPDNRTLYVAVSDEAAPRVMAYPLDAAGRAGRGRVLLDARPMMAAGGKGLTDGMKVLPDGTLLCTAPGGVAVLAPDGRMLGRIACDRAVANCALGPGEGGRGRSLFLAATDRLLRLPLRS